MDNKILLLVAAVGVAGIGYFLWKKPKEFVLKTGQTIIYKMEMMVFIRKVTL